MVDDTTKGFFESVIAGQARHILTGVAGTLIAHGALQSDQQNSFIQIGSGLAMYVVGAGWSWWQKSGQAMLQARLDKLRHHVAAIPAVTSAIDPRTGLIAAKETAKVNAAIEAAKEVATASP
jgi:hypothetical protein